MPKKRNFPRPYDFLTRIKTIISEDFYWVSFTVLMAPLAFSLRFIGLSNPFFDQHPIRQAQTALTAYYMAQGQVGFFDYSSPFDGALWNYVREFPLYQWAIAWFVKNGADLTFTARSLSVLIFFLATPFLYLVVKRYSSVRSARWATTFFFVLPFTVSFSRVCLPDMAALSMLITGFYFTSRYLDQPNIFHWCVATLLLSLAGLLKSPIWFSPVGWFGIYSSFIGIRSTSFRSKLPLFFSIAIQCALVGTWAYWAEQVYYRTPGILGGWLFGTLKQRLELASYWDLLRIFSQEILSVWLWIPLLLGMYSMRHRRIELSFLCVTAITPIFVFFNVSRFHNYYFLSLLVPVLFLSGKGMSELFQLALKPQRLLLIVFFLLIANGFRGTAATVETIAKSRLETLTPFERLKALTDPKDILFPDVLGDIVITAFYSQRLISQMQFLDLKKLKPSVLHIRNESSLISEFTWRFPRLAILANIDSTYVYRVEDVGLWQYDPHRHLAVTRSHSEKPNRELKEGEELVANTCKEPREFYLVKTPTSRTHVLSVKFDHSKTEFVLPSLGFLSLPRNSTWGCKVILRLRPPKF